MALIERVPLTAPVSEEESAMPQLRTYRPAAVFPKSMKTLPSDLTWLLDSDQQMDILMLDLEESSPSRIRIQTLKARLRTRSTK